MAFHAGIVATAREEHKVKHDEALRTAVVESETVDPNFEPVLNTDEAAALLQIHPKTLQRMARQGVIPAFRIGDLWRFRASSLDQWLRSGLCSKSHSCR
jgi:excisionase family DNA binding protein